MDYFTPMLVIQSKELACNNDNTDQFIGTLMKINNVNII